MFVYLDVETIPSQRPDVIERGADLVRVPANYKDPAKIEKYVSDHAKEAYHATGLDGGYGELCAICWAYGDDGVNDESRDPYQALPAGERDLLRAFFFSIRTYMQAHPTQPITFVGHNVAFDLRFLHHRSVVLQVPPGFWIPYNAATWGGKYVDTMYEWAGARDRVKLTELCDILGIEMDDEIDGSQVWDRYQAGDIATIVEHCIADVERVRAVHRRLRYL